jgi:hypothetical protein
MIGLLTIKGVAMCNAFENLLSHMSEKEIGYWSNQEQKAICVDLPGAVGIYRVFARVSDDGNQFDVSGHAHVRVAEGCRSAVAETIERANFGPARGNLEMNLDDGELRFNESEDLSGNELDGERIDRLIDAVRGALDCYLNAILSVIYGNELPEDAIRTVEARRCSES